MSSDTTSVPDRGPALRRLTIVLLVLTLTSFILRAYVRAHVTKAFGLDDWLMSGATIAFIFYGACVIVGVHYGTGRHFADLTAYNTEEALKFWFLCFIGYCWTMILSKLSIGIFLLRIVTQRSYKLILYACMALNTVIGLIFFFSTMFQCWPVSYFWNRLQAGGGTCVSGDVIIGLIYFYSALNIVCDFTFALLPIAIVRNLQMSRRLKMATMPLLCMGCVASAGVVVRLAFVQTYRDPDFLWATTDIAVWSLVEACLAITAGSLACTRPLFVSLFSQCSGGSRADSKYPGRSGPRGITATIGSSGQKRDVYRLGSLGGQSSHNHTDISTLTGKEHTESTEGLDWSQRKGDYAHEVDVRALEAGNRGTSSASDRDMHVREARRQEV